MTHFRKYHTLFKTILSETADGGEASGGCHFIEPLSLRFPRPERSHKIAYISTRPGPTEAACDACRMSPSSATAPDRATLRIHMRLQRWRHRERTRQPGLFASSLACCTPEPPVSLQRLRNGRCQLLISGAPIVLCGGCGALLVSPDAEHAASSASTQPPAGASTDSWVTCDGCSFTTPVGTLRRLLDLPDDRGPALAADIAQALLIEALGAPRSCKLHDKLLREWLLDLNSRTAGLDALCGALGVRDEQLEPVAVTDAKDETLAMIEAERFLVRSIPRDVMQPIPFSVAQLRTGSIDADSGTSAAEAREAAERAKTLVTEAVRIWRNAMGEATADAISAASILKLRALGKEYLVERTRARIYNLSQLHVPQKIQVTQPQQQPSHASGGNVPVSTDGA